MNTKSCRVVLLTTNDLFGCAILNHLLTEHPEFEPVALTRPPLIDTKADLVSPLQEYVYYNGVYCPEHYFPMLNNTQQHTGPYYTFEYLQSRHELIEFDSELVKHDVFLSLLKQEQIDLVLSIHFPVIIPKTILEAAPCEMINIHPGALPQYKGILCPVWAASHRQPLGATAHKITPAIDGGPIYSLTTTPFEPSKTLLLQHLSLYLMGLDALANTIKQHGSIKDLPALTQNTNDSAYYRYPSATEISRIGNPEGVFSQTILSNYLAEKFGVGLPATTSSVQTAFVE